MIGYIVAVLFSMLCALIMYVMLDKRLSAKISLLNCLGNSKEFESRDISKTERMLLIVFLTIGIFIAVVRLFMQVSDCLNIIRMLLIFIPLVGAGCVDYREKRIPNIFPISLFGTGIIYLFIELIFNKDVFKSYAVSCLLAMIGTFVVLFVVGAITGRGIGAGDIKILSSLGLLGGIYTLCGTVLYATVVCGAVAVISLLTKKKDMKGSLPFGPFILIGYIITVIVNVY